MMKAEIQVVDLPPTSTCRDCGGDLPADWRDPSGLCAVCMFENITENLAS